MNEDAKLHNIGLLLTYFSFRFNFLRFIEGSETDVQKVWVEILNYERILFFSHVSGTLKAVKFFLEFQSTSSLLR